MKVKSKTIDELKKYAFPVDRGDMDENMYYCLRFNGELIERKRKLDFTKTKINDIEGSFTFKPFHWSEHDTEFLVIDHPNIITKDEYERMKDLFTEGV